LGHFIEVEAGVVVDKVLKSRIRSRTVTVDLQRLRQRSILKEAGRLPLCSCKRRWRITPLYLDRRQCCVKILSGPLQLNRSPNRSLGFIESVEPATSVASATWRGDGDRSTRPS
jgi:hypothetical protein